MEIQYDEKRVDGIGHAIIGADQKVESEIMGQKLFEWLIHPMKASNFYNTYWEQQPLYIRRRNSASITMDGFRLLNC